MKSARSDGPSVHSGIEIYALCHPLNGEVRYIGKAADTKKRLASHLRDAKRRDTPVYRWIRRLGRDGLSPRAVVVAYCADGEWQDTERHRIAQARAQGLRLLNVADGGDEPGCSTEVRARNGRANAKAIHSSPTRKHLWRLKRDIGQHILDGTIRNSTREKLRLAAKLRPDLFGEWASLPDREEAPDGSAIRL